MEWYGRLWLLIGHLLSNEHVSTNEKPNGARTTVSTCGLVLRVFLSIPPEIPKFLFPLIAVIFSEAEISARVLTMFLVICVAFLLDYSPPAR